VAQWEQQQGKIDEISAIIHSYPNDDPCYPYRFGSFAVQDNL
jgi:hypothetical protein